MGRVDSGRNKQDYPRQEIEYVISLNKKEKCEKMLRMEKITEC